MVNTDVRLWAPVQTGRDLPSSTHITLIFTLIQSNCDACIEAKWDIIIIQGFTVIFLPQPTRIKARAAQQGVYNLLLSWTHETRKPA